MSALTTTSHGAPGEEGGTDWRSGQLYIPIAFRLGKVIVKEKHTWNFYGEYRTSLIYKGWEGSAVKNSYRINATYSIPVG